MPGTYRGRSRHRLPRREGARSAGRTGGAPQYVPADMYPPATESLQNRVRCPFPPPTWHGIPAKACQVSFPCCPPGTEIPRKRSRCLFPPSTCHGIPAKAFQVSFPAVHLPRNPRESVSGGIFLLPTCHGFPMKAFQVAPLVVHLARNSRESVSGVSSASHLPRQFISSRDVGVFQSGMWLFSA